MKKITVFLGALSLSAIIYSQDVRPTKDDEYYLALFFGVILPILAVLLGGFIGYLKYKKDKKNKLFVSIFILLMISTLPVLGQVNNQVSKDTGTSWWQIVLIIIIFSIIFLPKLRGNRFKKRQGDEKTT